MASIIAATTNNTEGMASMCPSAQIMPIRYQLSTYSPDNTTYGSSDVQFSYQRRITSNPHPVVYIPRFKDTANKIRVRIYADSIDIVNRAGAGTDDVLDSTNASSTLNTWYDMRVVCKGTRVEVYRRVTGSGTLFVLLLSSNDVTLMTTIRQSFHVGPSLYADFDNIRIRTPYNLDEFLQLNEGSPCIDKGEPPPQDGVTPAYHDFGDLESPLGPIVADTEGSRQDMGADEYPNLPEGVHWWERF